jgi:RNA-directed DNA polymerase
MEAQMTDEMQDQSRECPLRAKQGTEAAGRWSWVEASIWTERMVAALDNGVKGGKWFSLIDKVFAPRTLEVAWKKVSSNRGAAGIDRVSTERFSQRSKEYLDELSSALRSGSYRPEGVRRVHITKGPGQTRPLGIPTVKDRIVQTALKMVLEPIFEREFLPSSYGFRPGRGCKDALREVDQLLREGFTWVVDADLQSYFDSIPHQPLLRQVEGKVSDGRILALIESYLQQEVLDGVDRWTPTMGTPQGAIISPLLANLYLHPLDALIAAEGLRMVRYADDFVILCRRREDAERALRLVQEWTGKNGLTLHPDKTHLGDCMQAGEGFEFLGYRFEAGRRTVRKKSLKALRDKVRAKTGRSRGDSLECIIADLNPTLRGWFEYFKHAEVRTFGSIDGFVRRRLRSILRSHSKRPGRGNCLNDHKQWPNAFFAANGLFTLHEARLALASRPR